MHPAEDLISILVSYGVRFQVLCLHIIITLENKLYGLHVSNRMFEVGESELRKYLRFVQYVRAQREHKFDVVSTDILLLRPLRARVRWKDKDTT